MADQIFTQKDVDRFFAKTRRNEVTGCLEWTGTRNQNGYGVFAVGGRQRLAHRVAWSMAHGPVPPGICVLHHCDNPPCVEAGPGHLFPGTQADNIADKMRKGRQTRGDQHGVRKHPERAARGDAHGTHTHPESVRRGERSHYARLTEESVVAIRERRANGETGASIAADFGVSSGTVYLIAKRVTWAHIA